MTATYQHLRGKSVFITGGGSGIGAFLTEGFLAQGAQVAFVQRSDSSAFCDEMEAKHGTRPLFIQCDITDIAALKAAIARSADAHGDIEVLVNNAANDKRHEAGEVDEEFYDWMMAINLKAYFFACQAVAEGMKAKGGGSIINVIGTVIVEIEVNAVWQPVVVCVGLIQNRQFSVIELAVTVVVTQTGFVNVINAVVV